MDKYEPNQRRQDLRDPQREPQPREQMIRVDGRGQVLDMLRVADPQYREFLLRLLEKRDPALARSLRREL